MDFKKYGKIENSYRQNMVDKISAYFGKYTFVVQEKIHGANFSVWIENGKTRFGKRSGFIPEGENFYGHERVAKKLSDKLETLESLTKLTGDSFVIYGEIFGGSYEGLKSPEGVSKVQRGVNYSPDVEFMAFDVVHNGELLTVEKANNLLDTYSIPRVPQLMVGSLGECLEHPNDYNSKVPSLLGLPELSENIGEGSVIKLYDTVGVLPNGSRPILKNKNDKFSEKSRTPKVPKKVPEKVRPYMELVQSMINENRLRNVLSKIGKIEEPKQVFSKTMKPFTEDILEDFMSESEGFNDLDKEDQKHVTNMVGKEAANLIRKNLGAILDGEL